MLVFPPALSNIWILTLPIFYANSIILYHVPKKWAACPLFISVDHLVHNYLQLDNVVNGTVTFLPDYIHSETYWWKHSLRITDCAIIGSYVNRWIFRSAVTTPLVLSSILEILSHAFEFYTCSSLWNHHSFSLSLDPTSYVYIYNNRALKQPGNAIPPEVQLSEY